PYTTLFRSVRSNNGIPNCASSFWIPYVTADWARFSCFAAFEKLPVSATARNIRIWSRVSESIIIRYIDHLYRYFISFFDNPYLLGVVGNQLHRSLKCPPCSLSRSVLAMGSPRPEGSPRISSTRGKPRTPALLSLPAI